MFPFYSLGKYQKNDGFLRFSGFKKWELEMGQKWVKNLVVETNLYLELIIGTDFCFRFGAFLFVILVDITLLKW